MKPDYCQPPAKLHKDDTITMSDRALEHIVSDIFMQNHDCVMLRIAIANDHVAITSKERETTHKTSNVLEFSAFRRRERQLE